MMPSGHKSFLVNNVKDVELLMMHNRTYAAEYVFSPEASLHKHTPGYPSLDGHGITRSR